jgi:predicted anti-sigma-YlaC factor YlaD
MQCKEIELVLEQEGLEPLPEEARAHLTECAECRNYVADLTSLVDVARKLPREIVPPDRVWISLRAQLEAEGIIKAQPDVVAAPSASWWESIAAFFRTRSVAAVMVAILLVAGGVFMTRSEHSSEVATTSSMPAVSAPAQAPRPGTLVSTNAPQEPPKEFAGTVQVLNDQEPVATGMILSSSSPVDASLRDNLKKVNEFIAECEKHLKEQPQDALTREYLSAAYQQKAELLSAMIERGRSIN